MVVVEYIIAEGGGGGTGQVWSADAGTGGNPSRVRSYLSQNKGSSFMRFSYFVNNMDKL